MVEVASPYYWHAFIAGIAWIALWETFAPRRTLHVSWLRRWSLHGALFAITNALTFAALPIGALAAAVAFEGSPGGLLNRPWQPLWLRWVLAGLLIDAFRYLQHYTLHNAPWLWRLHQAHHSDPDYDLTTSLRFHPLEGLFTVATYIGFLFALRPPAGAVVVIELFMVVHGAFAHGNILVGVRSDRVLRRFLITPDLHRIHHSRDYDESRSNYGSIFPWWDLLFRTYRDQPAKGHQEMQIGLEGVSERQGISLVEAVIMPFRRSPQSAGGRRR